MQVRLRLGNLFDYPSWLICNSFQTWLSIVELENAYLLICRLGWERASITISAPIIINRGTTNVYCGGEKGRAHQLQLQMTTRAAWICDYFEGKWSQCSCYWADIWLGNYANWARCTKALVCLCCFVASLWLCTLFVVLCIVVQLSCFWRCNDGDDNDEEDLAREINTAAFGFEWKTKCKSMATREIKGIPFMNVEHWKVRRATYLWINYQFLLFPITYELLSAIYKCHSLVCAMRMWRRLWNATQRLPLYCWITLAFARLGSSAAHHRAAGMTVRRTDII